MAFDNLGGYRAAIADWLHRDDITTAVATGFVNLALARVNSDLRGAQMEAIVTATLDSEFSDLPDDFMAMRMLRTTTDGKPMTYYPPTQFQEAVYQNAVPVPPIYTIEDMQLRVLPAPTLTGTLAVEMLYTASNAQLTAADASTSWVMTACPQVLFYGVMAEAQMWLHAFDKASAWDTRYGQEFGRFKSMNRKLLHNHGPLQMRITQ